MRHSIKRISKSALSVILALMMVVSTMVVGMVTVGAATFSKVELVGNINGTDNWTSTNYPFTLNGSTWELTITFTQDSTFKARANEAWDISFGANNGGNATATPGTYKITIPDGASNNTNLTITEVATTAKFNGGDVYYLQPNDGWQSTNAWFAICLQSPVSGSTDQTWVRMDQVTGASPVTYKVTIPDGGWNNMDFVRMNKDKIELSYNSKWNSAYTGNSGVGYPSGTQNCLQITGWDNSGTWSTFVDKTNLAKPDVSVSNSNVVTSKANAKITVTSSGDSYPSGTTYTLLDASDNVVSGVTWNGNVATVEFADLSSADANYKVKVSADEATYNPAVSDEFNLKKVQLYAVTLAENADAVVTGTYTDAYGVSGKTIAEGETAYVPSGNTVHVNATVTDTANKTFNKFTYNGNNFANNADITITADGTISTVIDTVTYRTVKIAVISYADPDNHTSTTSGEYLTSKNVTYTFGGSTKTATMTAVAEDPTAYFAISDKWSGNGHKFYIYEIQVPSTVTSINVDGKKSITLDDTSEYYAIYHYSSAWNVSTFSTSDRYYYVNVVANTDFDSGATVIATGSASVKYNQDTNRTLYKYQSTIELTATPSDAAAFSYDHWSDGTSNIDSPYTVVGDATLTAYFKANQSYAINLVDTDANLASITSSPATSTYAGNTVKVTVTAKTGYECTGITVKTATDVDVDVTNNPDGTYSFTMPAEVVTVTPTITAKTLVNVTVKANDSSLGTVTVQSGNIYVGENFTVTATANSDSTFSSWTAVGADQVSTSTTDRVTTATFKATAQSVTITANFNTYVYSVITNSGEIEMTPSVADSNVFYSTDTVAKDAIFRIKRTFGSEVKYSVNSANSSTTWWFNNLSMEDVIPSWDGSDSVALNAGNYKNATGSAYYVKFDASTGTVSLSESTVGGTTVKVKAMNGVSTLSDLGTTVAEAANTSSSVVKEEVNLSGGTQYKVTKGSTVKVTTTMLADTEAAEKFVYAYVVNNKDTYLATEGIAVTRAEDKKYATYSAQFTIDEDTTESIFTVYPIYYYKACAKDGEYIKFYVDKSDAKNWGDNLYNYAYYYKTAGDTEDVYRSDGTWPGQPMLYDETKQLYYSLVPKQIGGKPVSGLTVNIGSDQLQSFDFDDFKVINEIGYDIVRLDLKQRSGHTQNKVTLFGAADATAYDKDKKTFSTPTYTYTNLVSDFNGRWEEYKDINGNDVSLLGKAVNADNTNTTYIVSSATHDSERGQWMSAFSVYKVDKDGNVTYITTDFPSEFIPRIVQDGQTEATANTSAYNAILNAGLGDAPVKIVYEDQVSTRIDGRWYYAQSDSEVCAYAYYRTYETTDCSGTPSALLINKDYSKIIAETELINDDGIVIGGKNSTLGKEISVVSSPLAGYIFDHWSVADKDGNIIINKLDNVGSSFTTTLDQEMHYVANFRKATQGQLVISHSKYTGSDAKNGLGYYRLEVQVKKSDDTWSTVYAGSGTGANGQSITANLAETDQIIRIKLITETAGENTFRYWYTTSSDGTEIIEDPDGDMTWNGTATSEPTGKNGILTYTFDTEVWKLFSGTKQIVTQLNFYSDIAPMNKNYKLTYKYTDRFGKEKIYVVKGTHDDSYYVKNNNSWAPSDELITKNAPPIDDLYKNCTWIIANSNKDGTDATLVAVQNGKTYKVDIYDASGASESFTYPINSYVINKQTGQFFVADEYIMVGETKNYFSYWAVYKRVEKDGKVTKGEEVARHFYREYTLVVLDDYWIEPVYGAERKDQVYISAPQYTREKYSNEDGELVNDILYADFMVAYMSSTGALIRDDSTGETYKTGVLVEFGPNYKLSTDANGIAENSDYSSITYDDSSKEKLEVAAKTLDNGKYLMYNFGTSDNKDYRAIYNFTANNSDYNNMNRLDYYVAFKNSPANRSYVMKAYYYVIVGDTFIVSNSVYFNLYDIGTSDPVTE